MPNHPMELKSVALGSDNLGAPLKSAVVDALTEQGYTVRDYGGDAQEESDYPDVAFEVAEAVARGDHDRAVLICGTGLGMAIAANKVKGVRAVTAHDPYSAERARMSNNAQVLTLGARVVTPELAKQVVAAWAAADFAGGNSARKVDKIDRYENA